MNDGFHAAIDALVGYGADAAAVIDHAWSELPDEVLGPVLAAWLAWREGDADGLALLRPSLEGRSLIGLPDDLAGHLLSAQRLADGDLWGAGQVLAALTVEHPGDIVALAAGHWIDLATGNTRLLTERVGRSLLQLDPTHPRLGRAQAMWAFGWAEHHDLERARRQATAVLETGPDPWALHTLVHCAELSSTPADVLAALDRPEWWPAADTALWWHLTHHRARAALALGDATAADDLLAHPDVHTTAGSRRAAADLVWHAAIDGHDSAAPAQRLLGHWPAEPVDLPDALARLMCQVAAGALSDAARAVEALEQRAEGSGATTSDHMLRAAGLTAARALLRFGQDLDEAVVDALAEVVPVVNVLGATSDERDTWERTLVVAAHRAGRHRLERALLSERLTRRGGGSWDQARWEAIGG